MLYFLINLVNQCFLQDTKITTFQSTTKKASPANKKLLNFVCIQLTSFWVFNFSFFNEICKQKKKTPNIETRKKVIKRNNKK